MALSLALNLRSLALRPCPWPLPHKLSLAVPLSAKLFWKQFLNVNNLSKTVTQLCPGENWTHFPLIASPMRYCATEKKYLWYTVWVRKNYPLRLLSIFAKRLGMPSRLAKIDKSRRGGGNFFWLTLYTCQDCRMCTWMPVTARDDNLQLFDSNACCSANRHISLTSTQTHIEMIMMMMIMNGFVNSIINELFGTVVEIDHYNSRGLK